ncbi:MAG TPA: galactokinase [Kosmotogaceae bacterium]|nr:MAG: Galactokinase [Thermotogales bacterium 46_20]HAA85258.1 galactokinase [Kosmotogaceae bacterium]
MALFVFLLKDAILMMISEMGGLHVTRKSIHALAPGRINIIGEHTDYNDGYVLPVTVDRYVQATVSERQGSSIRVFSEEEGTCEFDSQTISRSNNWCDYVKGICWVLKEEKAVLLPGMEVRIISTVPQGSGLSSSAALEVAVLIAMDELLKLGLSEEEKYILARRAENDFVGVKCGVMDQFAAVMGKERHAIFLDTQSMHHDYVPLDLGDYAFMVIDSGVRHSLSSGEYNKRREEASFALRELGKTSYRDLTISELLSARKNLKPEYYRRAMHIITENERVLDSVRSLKSSNFENLGRFLLQSHESLAYDYEVSCDEVDYIVSLLREKPSVTGCRMMGGGFGGSVLAVCETDEVDAVSEDIKNNYYERFGITARVFLVRPDGKARILDLPLLVEGREKL